MMKLIIYLFLLWLFSKLVKILTQTAQKKHEEKKIEYKPIYADNLPSQGKIKTISSFKPQTIKKKKDKSSFLKKKKGWKNYLSSPSSLKDAIIISEILAKPLSERDL